MAVVRARNAPPYGAVIFAFLFAISTVIAIWVAIQKGDAEKRAADAEKRAANALKNTNDAGTSLGTLKSYLVAKDDTGKNIADVTAIADKALGDAGFAKSNFVYALQQTSQKLREAEANAADLESKRAELAAQLTKMVETHKAELAASQDAFKKENTAHLASADEAAKERADKESKVKEMQDELTKTKDAAEKDRRELILKLEEANQKLAVANEDIKRLKGIIAGKGTGGHLAQNIEPAGTVVRARPGNTEAYISLGRKDRIQPGLTFSIHDPRVGVKLQSDTDMNKADPDAGGKGGLEVMEVGENESLCRVTFMKKGQHIEQGDLIANPVYQRDRAKKFHFVVFGDFDLDGDGVATAGERDRLIRMVSSWGGTVDDKISPDTDYLVLGGRPASPSTKTDVQPGGVGDTRATDQKKYDELWAEAKSSNVPVLNANRFLAMIGYYNTTIVH